MSKTLRRHPKTYKKRGIQEKDKNSCGKIWLDHAPADYRRLLNRKYRAEVKDALHKEKELPVFKQNAPYVYW